MRIFENPFLILLPFRSFDEETQISYFASFFALLLFQTWNQRLSHLIPSVQSAKQQDLALLSGSISSGSTHLMLAFDTKSALCHLFTSLYSFQSEKKSFSCFTHLLNQSLNLFMPKATKEYKYPSTHNSLNYLQINKLCFRVGLEGAAPWCNISMGNQNNNKRIITHVKEKLLTLIK